MLLLLWVMKMQEIWKSTEEQYKSIKGAFSTEQFGVFLNMYSFEIEDNYLIAFHEDYHYWQSIFTPFGHLMWGMNRTTSTEIIEAWLTATANNPTERIIPAAGILPTDDKTAILGVSHIWKQYIAKQVANLVVRKNNNSVISKLLPPDIGPLLPSITINDQVHELKGLDILEGLAKFQEAALAYIAEERPFQETIDENKLSPEYYIALKYFVEKVGHDRITEFPVACELALCVCDFCMPGQPGWQSMHPAWRFLSIVDQMANSQCFNLVYSDKAAEQYLIYTNSILEACGYMNWSDVWNHAKAYALKEKTEITNDMLRAIEFKQRYPWVLAYPFINFAVFHKMAEFRPYYYTTSDKSGYVVKSEDQGNEVILENQYQALANQICGIPSKRCIDTGKIQCGYSYYGIRRCPYLLDDTCDGYLDRNSNIPGIEMDISGNIVDGCAFDIFLAMLGVRVKDLIITDISKQINHNLLREMIDKHCK